MLKSKILVLTVLSIMPLALAGCGTSDKERGLSGAGIGAGVGAAAGAVTGGSIAGGAIAGGLIGGATGVLTDSDDINLDR